ncbi:MAG TPA: acyl-ACP--UDP-N-acetylglucosamine O-acyltransferase [Verrucomicrobiae bacterium]|jgi:UDP-N-acetylglucosamine acyltransferase|nr:acyl-ACP--UDP-N-acetylglucosamine O-acyltransferase [Verrucomicrobiae bacterium]
MPKDLALPEPGEEESMIHSTAVIHPRAEIGADCHIGPYCVIGEHVALGRGSRLHSHVVIDGYTRIGEENEIFPFVSIGLKTQDLKWKGGLTRTVIGDHNIIREFVTIHSATSDGDATTIGNHNVLLAYSHVAHDVTIGDQVVMSNVGTLAGHVTVEDHAIVGGLAAVHQFCRIGKLSMIGGCSKVVQDVLPFMIVDGNPGVTRTINKVGLERGGVPEETQSALRQAYKILFRDGLTIPNALSRIEAELPSSPELMHLIQFIRTSERGFTK